MAVKRNKKRIKIKPVVLKVIVLLLTVYFIYLFYSQSVTHFGLVSESEKLEKEIEEVKEEIEELQDYIYRLEDKEYLELLAREELGLIGSEEILIDVRPLMSELDDIEEEGERENWFW